MQPRSLMLLGQNDTSVGSKDFLFIIIQNAQYGLAVYQPLIGSYDMFGCGLGCINWNLPMAAQN